MEYLARYWVEYLLTSSDIQQSYLAVFWISKTRYLVLWFILLKQVKKSRKNLICWSVYFSCKLRSKIVKKNCYILFLGRPRRSPAPFTPVLRTSTMLTKVCQTKQKNKHCRSKRVGIHIQVISSNTDLQYGQLATTHSNIIVKLVDPCDFARSFV